MDFIQLRWARSLTHARSADISSAFADEARAGKDRWCPEEQAGFLSTITYSYATSLVKLGCKKTLLAGDLWDMSQWDEARTISSRIQGCMDATKDPVTAPKVTGLRGQIPFISWRLY